MAWPWPLYLALLQAGNRWRVPLGVTSAIASSYSLLAERLITVLSLLAQPRALPRYLDVQPLLESVSTPSTHRP